MLHQRIESSFDQTAEYRFVQHGLSLTSLARRVRPGSVGAASRAVSKALLPQSRYSCGSFRVLPRIFSAFSRQTRKLFTVAAAYFAQASNLRSGGQRDARTVDFDRDTGPGAGSLLRPDCRGPRRQVFVVG